MIQENKTYIVEYPFCRDKVVLCDEEGCYTEDTWRPGTRQVSGNDGERSKHWTEADAIGKMLLSVVSIHRPGNYPARVFFTRQWEDPDGKVFGRENLHIKAQSAFNRMLKGYRHKFTLPDSEPKSEGRK